MAGEDARRHRTRESTIMLSSLVLTWFSGDHSSFKEHSRFRPRHERAGIAQSIFHEQQSLGDRSIDFDLKSSPSRRGFVKSVPRQLIAASAGLKLAPVSACRFRRNFIIGCHCLLCCRVNWRGTALRPSSAGTSVLVFGIYRRDQSP